MNWSKGWDTVVKPMQEANRAAKESQNKFIKQPPVKEDQNPLSVGMTIEYIMDIETGKPDESMMNVIRNNECIVVKEIVETVINIAQPDAWPIAVEATQVGDLAVHKSISKEEAGD